MSMLPFEVLTVRAADVVDADAIELPDLVYVWDDKRSQWLGKNTATEPRLRLPRWHHIYDAFDQGCQGSLDAGPMLNTLQDRYVLLRIATEHPGDAGHEDAWVALHELDLVRIQRPQPDEVASGGLQAPAWVVLDAALGVVHWNDTSPGVEVFLVDWDDAENDSEYVRAKLAQLGEATYLPEPVRERLRIELTR